MHVVYIKYAVYAKSKFWASGDIKTLIYNLLGYSNDGRHF